MTTRREFILGLLATTTMTRSSVFCSEDWLDWFFIQNAQWAIYDDSYLGKQHLSTHYASSYSDTSGNSQTLQSQ